MKLDKILALTAYAVQAIATLGVVFGVSSILSGADYGHYSLIVASAQSASVLAFEWVRLAAARFCANTSVDNHESRKSTIQAAFFGAAFILSLTALVVSVVGSVDPILIVLGLAVAVLIGLTDLLLVFLRVQGSFKQFALLQMSRAFLLLGCSVGGAIWGHTALSALVGMVAGYAAALLLYIVVAPSWWRWRPALVSGATFNDMATYGVSVAAASNIHLQVPLMIRWVGKAILSTEGFAGLSLALDVLQKPFALVTSAIGGVLTPGVIVEFERNKDANAPKLRQIYEVQVWAVLLLTGGCIAFLPDVAAWVVKPELRDWVVRFGPSFAVLFALHALIQSTIAIPGHLLHKGRRLISHALIELVCVGLLVSSALWVEAIRPVAWINLGVIGAFLALLVALPLVREVPCKLPNEAVAIGCAVAALLSALYWMPGMGEVVGAVIKFCLAFFIMAGGGYLYRPYFKQSM